MLLGKRVSLIAAMNDNRVIGDQGRIPWHSREDFAHFKRTTMGYPCVMGRKTWESLPGALSGRQMIVVTRSPQDLTVPEGVTVAASFEEAVAEAVGDKVFIIGGSQMYAEALPFADELFLTIINDDSDGDTKFPDFKDFFNEIVWEKEQSDCFFVHYVR